MNQDGSDQTNLTNAASDDIDPAWSPDGRKIAFSSDRDGSFQIYIMNPDGSDLVRLTDGPGNHVYPAWSPDGRQLAYSSNAQGSYDIYVMQADGSDAANVTKSQGTDYAPSWSADGATLAFWSDRDREPRDVLGLSFSDRDIKQLNTDIFVMDARGGTARNLTIGIEPELESAGLINEEQHGFYGPSWSPQGGRIAFVNRNFGPPFSDIGLMDEAGGVQWLGLRSSQESSPAWSTDGATLAFSDVVFGNRRQGRGIWTIPAAGGPPAQLTDIERYANHPTWSPGVSAASSVDYVPWSEVKRGRQTPVTRPE